jgi:hypothetical protein
MRGPSNPRTTRIRKKSSGFSFPPSSTAARGVSVLSNFLEKGLIEKPCSALLLSLRSRCEMDLVGDHGLIFSGPEG